MVANRDGLVSYEEALTLTLDRARPLGAEEVPLDKLLGRVLLSPVAATCDLPPFDNSAVDGFAFSMSDVQDGVRWRSFRLVGESRAGTHVPESIGHGEALRVFTGAPLPPGTGAVAMQEVCVVDDGHVKVDEAVDIEDHVRRRGCEGHLGDTIVPQMILTPPAIGAIASGGHSSATVFKQPTVGILVTGDELALPGSSLRPGQIFESNGTAIRAALLALGLLDPVVLRSKDDVRSVEGALRELLDSCDVVITSGGVSVGEHDVVRPALQSAKVDQVFWGVAIKPGKPMYYGRRGNCAVFGLPGNPVSALVTFRLFVQPYVNKISGWSAAEKRERHVLTQSLTKRSGRAEFVPCQIRADGAHPVVGRASHKASCLAEADGLVILGSEVEIAAAGEQVDVLRLQWSGFP